MAHPVKAWLLRLMASTGFAGRLVGGVDGEDYLAGQVAADLRQWTLEGKLRAVWTKIPHEVGAVSKKSPAFRVAQARYAKQIAMGLIAGSGDLVFTWRKVTGEYPGNDGGWIELKSLTGSLSKDQRDFRDWCEAAGVRHAICRTRTEVKQKLVEWGCLEL